MWQKIKLYLHLLTCPHKVCLTKEINLQDRYCLKQCVCCEKEIYEKI